MSMLCFITTLFGSLTTVDTEYELEQAIPCIKQYDIMTSILIALYGIIALCLCIRARSIIT